jgi:glyoxylase-like metal-dependent hydrolase (beta-lactamase superfamily II)
VAFLPDDGIVFMSDLLFVDFHPYLGDGDPQRWLDVLRSILDGSAGIQGVNRFVPGHGPTGTSADVQQMIDYIQDCQKIAQMLIQENKTGEADVAAVPVPEAYAGWTMPRFFHANIQFLIGKYQKTTSSI